MALNSTPGKVFTRRDILEQVWEVDIYVGDRTIDVHINRLRDKIYQDYIKTIKGIGYANWLDFLPYLLS